MIYIYGMVKWVLRNEFKLSPFHTGKYRRDFLIFFDAVYWVIYFFKPKVIEFLGCDMYYPQIGNTHFYGVGKADPVRFGADRLIFWINKLKGYCVENNIILKKLSKENRGYFNL